MRRGFKIPFSFPPPCRPGNCHSLGGTMPYQTMSCLTRLFLAILIVGLAFEAQAAKMYLDPGDTLYYTDGVGTEIDLELRVDADVQSLKLFVARLDFDPTKLRVAFTIDSVWEYDTISYDPLEIDTILSWVDTTELITEGTFWDTTGWMTHFDFFHLQNDSVLRIEGLVFGAGVSADGPGLLASIKLETIDTGITDLAFNYSSLKNVSGDQIPHDVEGVVIVQDVPPDAFDLLDPHIGTSVIGLPGQDTITLVWSSSSSIYPGEGVVYNLDFGNSASFHPDSTRSWTGLTDTTQIIPVDETLVPGTYYWRMVAVGDLYGFEREGNPLPSWFRFAYEDVWPGEFELISPATGDTLNINSTASVLFDWEDAGTVIPDDTITYILYLGPDSTLPDPGLPGSQTIADTAIMESEIAMDTSVVPRGEIEYWRVIAVNKFGFFTWSTSTFSALFYHRGDINNDLQMDIADLLFLVEHMFNFGPAPPIWQSADLDCSTEVDIGDLLFMVEFMFGSPPGPFPGCTY